MTDDPTVAALLRDRDRALILIGEIRELCGGGEGSTLQMVEAIVTENQKLREQLGKRHVAEPIPARSFIADDTIDRLARDVGTVIRPAPARDELEEIRAECGGGKGTTLQLVKALAAESRRLRAALDYAVGVSRSNADAIELAAK